MDDIKHAAAAAQQFLTSLVEDADAVRLEEVELGPDGEGWSITLSFIGQTGSPLQFGRARIYKRFLVEDGQVRSMKIRELAGA
jgi:hypothetical protein